jgi:hypothetical protein
MAEQRATAIRQTRIVVEFFGATKSKKKIVDDGIDGSQEGLSH